MVACDSERMRYNMKSLGGWFSEVQECIAALLKKRAWHEFHKSFTLRDNFHPFRWNRHLFIWKFHIYRRKFPRFYVKVSHFLRQFSRFYLQVARFFMRSHQTKRGKRDRIFHASPTALACVPLSSCYFAMVLHVDSSLSRFIRPTAQPMLVSFSFDSLF